MTIIYRDDSFSLLIFRWKGSIWKAVYPTYLLWLGTYFIISLIYRFALGKEDRDRFAHAVVYTNGFQGYIPLEFMTGFYVAYVVSRAWTQVLCLGDPTEFSSYVATFIKGTDTEARIIKRNIVRYVGLATLLVFRKMSIKVFKRFPTHQHLVLSGLMNDDELDLYESSMHYYEPWYVPLQWATNLMKKCHEQGRLSDVSIQILLNKMDEARSDCQKLIGYDYICVPLIYTQFTVAGSILYFVICLLSRQSLIVDGMHFFEGYDVDIVFPVFTSIEFLVFIGWLKVGQIFLGPWGEDDEDIMIHYYMDRNFTASLFIVDHLAEQEPPLEKDGLWGMRCPMLARTAGSTEEDTWTRLKSGHRLDKLKFTEDELQIAIGTHDRVNDDPWPNWDINEVDDYGLGLVPDDSVAHRFTEGLKQVLVKK